MRWLVLLMVCAQAANAAEWREVGEVPATGTLVSVDDSSFVTERGSIVSGWVKFDYAKPVERDGRKLVAYASRRMVNCEMNRYWVMDGWGYPPKDAEPVRIYSTDQEWLMPAPDSEAEIASAALCVEGSSILGFAWSGFQIVSRLQTVWNTIKGTIFR